MNTSSPVPGTVKAGPSRPLLDGLVAKFYFCLLGQWRGLISGDLHPLHHIRFGEAARRNVARWNLKRNHGLSDHEKRQPGMAKVQPELSNVGFETAEMPCEGSNVSVGKKLGKAAEPPPALCAGAW